MSVPKRKALRSFQQVQSAFQNQHADFTRVATNLIARLAQAGHIVEKGNNFDFIVHRWGMSCYLENHAALQRFAGIVGLHHD